MADNFLHRALLEQKSAGQGRNLAQGGNLSAAASRRRSRAERAEAKKRLQIGVGGIIAMVLLVVLADVISDRANRSEASAVPESKVIVPEEEEPAPKNDPLAEAGVVPDLPASPEPAARQEPGIELTPAEPVAEE